MGIDMKKRDERIEILRHSSRKLIRELGMLQLHKGDSKATPAHWHMLIEISKNPGITISSLGNLLLMSLPTVSRLVKSLDGFLKITEGDDKREKYLYLTDKGHAEIKKIDAYSESKIIRSFEFLADEEIALIIESISKYSDALEKSRLIRERIKIRTISTSRTLRKQIVNMIENIQRSEFSIPIAPGMNSCVLQAEQDFYYNNSYNFWYAVDEGGKIIGSCGLKKIDEWSGEIKKLFVAKEYRGKEVAQKLMNVLIKAAQKHKFEHLFLGTVDKFHAAHKFYSKCGFIAIDQTELPKTFEICPVDNMFFKGNVKDL
jgi:DNA-binding MarR family transcriptional regulator/N-acetylglutamate synthase-like GNAT family acetyltransferase